MAKNWTTKSSGFWTGEKTVKQHKIDDSGKRTVSEGKGKTWTEADKNSRR